MKQSSCKPKIIKDYKNIEMKIRTKSEKMTVIYVDWKHRNEKELSILKQMELFVKVNLNSFSSKKN